MTATRYVAFLRGINVGGHNVKMDRLRAEMEPLAITDVSTLIASGNVMFSADTDDVSILEQQIEHRLLEALGYEVLTFVRSATDLTKLAAAEPFSDVSLSPLDKNLVYVGFLRRPLVASERAAVLALETETDHLHAKGRELQWLPTTNMSDSRVTGPRLEKALGQPTTLRNSNTVRRLTARLAV